MLDRKFFETEEKLEDLINNCVFSERRCAFYMANYAHRYLQHKLFIIAIFFIQLLAEKCEKGQYDGRNEYACKKSKAIIDALKEDEDYYPMDFSDMNNE